MYIHTCMLNWNIVCGSHFAGVLTRSTTRTHSTYFEALYAAIYYYSSSIYILLYHLHMLCIYSSLYIQYRVLLYILNEIKNVA